MKTWHLLFICFILEALSRETRAERSPDDNIHDIAARAARISSPSLFDSVDYSDDEASEAGINQPPEERPKILLSFDPAADDSVEKEKAHDPLSWWEKILDWFSGKKAPQ